MTLAGIRPLAPTLIPFASAHTRTAWLSMTCARSPRCLPRRVPSSLAALRPPLDVGRQGVTQLGGILDRQVDLEFLPVEAELDGLGGFRSVSVVDEPGQDFGNHVDSSPGASHHRDKP